MAKNLILAISFGFKLNSNLNCSSRESNWGNSETLKTQVKLVFNSTSLVWLFIYSVEGKMFRLKY